MIRILLVLILLAVGYLFLSSAFRPEGATDPVDIWTEAEIRAEIDLHPKLWFRQLDVFCNSGVVTLRGHLPSAAEAELAVSLAKNVPTVEDVDNQIELSSDSEVTEQPAEAPKTGNSDQLLQHQIISVILHDRDTCSLHPQVTVNNGSVVLQGQVTDELDRVAVEALLVAMPGVKSVDNQLKVVSSDVSNIPQGILARFRGVAVDPWIQSKVVRRLQSLKESANEQIEASTKDGVVTLRGVVHSENQAERIASALGKILGVTGVNNELTVVGNEKVSDLADDSEADDSEVTPF